MSLGMNGSGPGYHAPSDDLVARIPMATLFDGTRSVPDDKLRRLPGYAGGVFCVGHRELLARKSIAVVGSRKVSREGAARARRLAKELVARGLVVVSGLAEGVDSNAHQAAIDAGGETIAVIGTPVDRAYPKHHAELQERIYRDHLLISPFPIGADTRRSSFPERNRLMAAISDGTCIIEASDDSGSLHQARECAGLGRWLFILKSNVTNPQVTWPREFLSSKHSERVVVVERVDDILNVLQ
jgi:DNA processing protein